MSHFVKVWMASDLVLVLAVDVKGAQGCPQVVQLLGCHWHQAFGSERVCTYFTLLWKCCKQRVINKIGRQFKFSRKRVKGKVKRSDQRHEIDCFTNKCTNIPKLPPPFLPKTHTHACRSSSNCCWNYSWSPHCANAKDNLQGRDSYTLIVLTEKLVKRGQGRK